MRDGWIDIRVDEKDGIVGEMGVCMYVTCLFIDS